MFMLYGKIGLICLYQVGVSDRGSLHSTVSLVIGDCSNRPARGGVIKVGLSL